MSDDARVAAAMGQITALSAQIEKAQKGHRNQTLGAAAKGKALATVAAPRSRRALRGHFGKVAALHWGGDSQHLVSAAQDGNLIVWNAVTGNKVQAIHLKSSYVMSVGIEQSKGDLLACGGLDNLCTVYRRSAGASPEPTEMPAAHDGFLSCCRFLSESEVLTASGDASCIHWDVARGAPLNRFRGHLADAMFLALRDRHTFASCSVDRTIKLWDVRAPQVSTKTLVGHLGDVNGVAVLPSTDSNCLASCSQDGTVRVWDLRVDNEVARIGHAVAPDPARVENDGFTSIAASASGRLLFCGHSDGSVHAFDVLSEKNGPAFLLSGAHERHVSCVGVSPDGNGLCTGGWDSVLKVWA